MAGNINTAARALWRNTTRFKALKIHQILTKADSSGQGTYAGLTPLTIINVPSQTADSIAVMNSSGTTIFAVGADGAVKGNVTVAAAFVTVTLAQLKAGATIVAGVTGRTLTPIRFRIKFTGAFTTATTIRLSDTAGSPVDIATVAIANATDGNILTETGGTGLTIGAGYGAALTIDKGIQLRDVTANTAAGGTSIDVLVDYLVN